MGKTRPAYDRDAHRPASAGSRRPWASRAAVLAVSIILVLIGVLLYAGPAAGLVALTLGVDGVLSIAWLAGAMGLGALILLIVSPAEAIPTDGVSPPPPSSSLHPRSSISPPRARDPQWLLGFVTAAALGLGVYSLVLLGLGLAGWLNRATGFGLLGAGIGAGIGAMIVQHGRDRSTDRSAGATGRLRCWWLAPAGWEWVLLIVVPFASVALAGAMTPAGLLWTPDEPHGYDVVEYHLQVPREWYEAGRIIPLHHNVFSYFPMGVEVHYLLAMHLEGGPWAGVYLAQLMHLWFIVLSILGAGAFAVQLARNRAAAYVAIIALCTVPFLAQLGAIAYNEGGFFLYGTLAIGWSLRAATDPRHRLRRFILAGVMAGFACGVKLTAVPEVLLMLPIIALAVLLAPRFRGLRIGAKPLLGPVAFGLAGLVVFSPWLIRNAVWAGNPVFPEAMPLLGHAHFSVEQIQRWEKAHHAQPDESAPLRRLRAGWVQVISNWQFGFVLLPGAVLALIAARRRPEAGFLGAALLLLTVFWLGFTHLQGRFYLLAVPIAGMLLAMIPRPRWAMAAMIPVLMAAVFVGLKLNLDLRGKLYRGPYPSEWLARVMGNTEPSDVPNVPAGASVTFVGDATPFWYKTPMPRLHYRTIFDADTSHGRGLPDAWNVPGARAAGEWVIVDSGELQRFEKTYQPMAPPPPQWTSQPEWAQQAPIILQPVTGTGK